MYIQKILLWPRQTKSMTVFQTCYSFDLEFCVPYDTHWTSRKSVNMKFEGFHVIFLFFLSEILDLKGDSNLFEYRRG